KASALDYTGGDCEFPVVSSCDGFVSTAFFSPAVEHRRENPGRTSGTIRRIGILRPHATAPLRFLAHRRTALRHAGESSIPPESHPRQRTVCSRNLRQTAKNRRRHDGALAAGTFPEA